MSADIVTLGGSKLPAARPAEALEMTLDWTLKVVDGVAPSQQRTGERVKWRSALNRAEALDLEDLCHRLDDAMQPATVKQIALLCARLVAAYPTKNRDPEFGVILLEEVTAAEPSVAVLERAVRRLVRTEKFLPSVAEVLEEIGEADWHLNHKRRELAKAPERIAMAREILRRLERTPEELERDNRLAEQRKFEREVESYIDLVQSGAVFDGPKETVLMHQKWPENWKRYRFSDAVAREAQRRLDE